MEVADSRMAPSDLYVKFAIYKIAPNISRRYYLAARQVSRYINSPRTAGITRR